MKVPILDLKAQYESIREEFTWALQQVLDKTAFACGPFVDAFEKEFAEFCQCRQAVGVSSGTSALWLTMLGLGIGDGDEVITTQNTFIATAEAISFCRAKPVFVDVEEGTFTMNPDLLEKAIKIEDALNYNEPPDWFFSVRHHLGAIQLEAGQFTEAVETYREDLQNLPKNGWALKGLANAFSALNEASNLEATEKEFDKVWATADIELYSSVIK